MGTSSSSSGPESGVPFDPPWLDTVDSEIVSPLGQVSDDSSQPDQNPQQTGPAPQLLDVAPPRRFGNARLHLGKYASSGDIGSLKKALGNYSRNGMGGASKVARRMRISTSVGATLFNFLQEARGSSESEVRDWVNQLTAKNLSAYEIGDEVAKWLIATDGIIEEESCKGSIAQAVSELLTIKPTSDLGNMDNDSIWTVIELFISNEAYNRIYHDIGLLFENSKYSRKDAVSRANEMREYLKSEISAQIQELRKGTSNPTKVEMENLLQTAIKFTFEVFEEGV